MKRIFAAIVAAVTLGAGLLFGLGGPNEVQSTDHTQPGHILPWLEGDGGGSYPSSQRFLFQPQFRPFYPDSPAFVQNVYAPQEHREAEYRKWLKVSVRIRNGNISGSGTICYYDPQKKTAWVISCGHLFRGGEKTCQIHVFYKNDTKLASPQTYTATILCWTPPIDDGGDDISFLSFQPDWDLDFYAPIAKADFAYQSGTTYYSCGCDGAREVACYLMKAKGMEGRNLVLNENLPRRGRSGGGLMTADGWDIGICWGSTDPDGNRGFGKGLFVPLTKIHAYARQQNLGWLLEVGMRQQVPARRIPIIDWPTGQQRQAQPDYIPIP